MQNTVRNLSDLTKEELEQIAQSQQGKATLVIIHPYYASSKNPGLDNFLTKGKHKGRLIIFLEEAVKVNELKEKLTKLGAAKNHTILIVPILPFNPQPTKGWQKFFKQLDALKVKKIVVGGKKIQRTTLEEMLGRNPLAITFPKRFAKEQKEYIEATKARIRAAELNAGRGYTLCAGTTWSMLKARGKQRVKIVQNQFTTARRK
jgi:hypothetical protein